MKISHKKFDIEDILDNEYVSKYIKIGGVIIVVVSGIYVLGFVFKTSANTINGFNQLKIALKNGK